MRLVARKWWTAFGGAAGALSVASTAPVAAAAAAVTACGDDCACWHPEVDAGELDVVAP